MIHICNFEGHDLCLCVCCFLLRGHLGGLVLLLFDLRVSWIQLESSVTEMEELIQEPARIEDGG